MTDYSKMTDEEINRAVAEKVDSCIAEDDLLSDGGFTAYLTEDGDDDELAQVGPKDFCNDPSAWGWLMELERIAMDPSRRSDEWYAWKNTGTATAMEAKPGRAIAIAYLESKEEA